MSACAYVRACRRPIYSGRQASPLGAPASFTQEEDNTQIHTHTYMFLLHLRSAVLAFFYREESSAILLPR